MLEKLKNKLQIKSDQLVSSIKVSEETRNERLAICKSCEYLHQTQFCKLCGCFMPVKTYIPISECPKKKWLQVNSSE